MNVLEMVRRQQQRKDAIKRAQAIHAKVLCYRGLCYVKPLSV
tara:strand:+ start:206 stop:331 length:126 start_codon:yes stop_codon:yes gene_type:complete